MNTRDLPYLEVDDDARDLLNVNSLLQGGITKRNGLLTFASPANTWTSLYALEATASPFLIGADASALYSVSATGTVTSIKTGLSNHRWEFVSGPSVGGQGPLYGMNGTDTPQQWTGSGSTAAWTATDAGGSVPNGKYCIVSQNQVFVAGVSGQPSRLYWSGIADPTAWNPANLNGSGFMDFDPNDGQAITAIGHVGPYVLVAKPRKLFVLVDAATAQSRRISDSIGIAAHRSIASGAEGTYFLAEDRGVYVTNGSKVTAISDKIQPTFDALPTRTTAAAAYFNGHYYLSVQSGSSNDTTYDFDAVIAPSVADHQSWWKHSFGVNQFAVWHPSGPAALFSAKGTGPGVDQAFAPGALVDNGTAFQWFWKGPWQSPTFYRRRRFPTTYFRKRLRQVRLEGTGIVDLSLAKDWGGDVLLKQNVFNYSPGGDTFAGTGVFAGADGSMFGGNPSVQRYRQFSSGVANAFSLVVSGTSSSPGAMYSYVLEMTDRRDLVQS